MEQFKILPTTDYYGHYILRKTVQGFYHSNYFGGGNWSIDGAIENMIWTLKNDVNPFPSRLSKSKEILRMILLTDLPEILQMTEYKRLTVVVVPRAKVESNYRADQLYFREIVSNVASNLGDGFSDGTKYITRHTNTKTTHLRDGKGGDGSYPYLGITKDTCHFSPYITGNDILLIDDIYTNTVNIDEDAIQALFDKGANSVTFYCIGKTVRKNYY